MVDWPVCFLFSTFFLFSELREVKCAIYTMIAKIPNFSIVSFIGCYSFRFTKFSTLVEHQLDCLPWKFDGGLQQIILRELPKTWNFCTCTCKSAHCVYIRGSKVNVERTPSRPFSCGSIAVLSVQKFASVPELSAQNCRHRSRFLSF